MFFNFVNLKVILRPSVHIQPYPPPYLGRGVGSNKHQYTSKSSILILVLTTGMGEDSLLCVWSSAGFQIPYYSHSIVWDKKNIGLSNRGAVKILRQQHILVKLSYSPEHNRYPLLLLLQDSSRKNETTLRVCYHYHCISVSFNLFTFLAELRDNKNIFEELKNTASSSDALL